MSGERIERAISLVLALIAIVIMAAIVHREFPTDELRASSPAIAENPFTAPPVYLPEWKSLLDVAIREDTGNAPVVIVEFGDFECPACRSLETTLDSIRSRFGPSVSVVLVHFPLPQHRFARPAARAAECARTQGRFTPMARTIYRFQDSLGLRPWSAYAVEAGVSDTVAFNRCVTDQSPLPAVEAGFEAGKRIQLAGTPTVIVNGWRYRGAPSLDVLSNAITELLAGRALNTKG